MGLTASQGHEVVRRALRRVCAIYVNGHCRRTELCPRSGIEGGHRQDVAKCLVMTQGGQGYSYAQTGPRAAIGGGRMGQFSFSTSSRQRWRLLTSELFRSR
jgi:hypothetical protein